MDKPTHKPKRSRKSAPKSRQGCITCKTRHVKCDETRPYCKRCAKAGRKCEGFVQDEEDENFARIENETDTSSSSTSLVRVSSGVTTLSETSSSNASSNTKSPSYKSPARKAAASKSGSQSLDTGDLLQIGDPSNISINLGTFNNQESRFLEYFYKRTAPAISGYYDANFYNRLLLQAGQHEPAIRHSMMAVAAMHEHFEFSVVPALEQRRERVTNDERPAFALQQYNKAISAISKQLSSGPESMEPVLMCCLLFACLECLRGDNAAAAKHLKSGGDIIANMSRKKRSPSPELPEPPPSTEPATESPSTDSKFIDTNLVPIFERLSTHVGGAAHLTSWEWGDLINPDLCHDGPLEVSFETLDEARKSIMNLGSLVTRFTRSVAMLKYAATEITEEHLLALAGLKRKLQSWDDSMNVYLEKRKHDTGLTRRAVVLQVQHKCFVVVVMTALSPDQCANDCITKDFETGVNLAELLLDYSQTVLPAQDDEQDLHAFSLEEGVTPALFIFATRCRVPSLRRKAIATMRKGPRRQGIWNAVLLAKISERVIDLEENYQPPIQEISPLDALIAPGMLDPILEANIDPYLANLPMTPESIESYQTVDIDAADPQVVVPGPQVAPASQVVDPFLIGFDAPILPCEPARIHHVDIKESVDGGPHEHAITFFRKPNGLDGDWEIWTEPMSI